MSSPAPIYGAGQDLHAMNSIPDVRKIFVHNPQCKLADRYELENPVAQAAMFAGGS
jgi:hypothetical protein